MTSASSIFTDTDPLTVLSSVILIIIVPLILNFFDKYFGYIWRDTFERKKEYLWKESVLRNKTAKESFDTYKRIGSNNYFGLLCLYIGAILGSFLTIIVISSSVYFVKNLNEIKVFSGVSADQLLSLIIPLLILIIELCLIVISNMINSYSKSIQGEKILTKYNSILNLNLSVSSFTALFFIFFLFLFLPLYGFRSTLGNYFYPSILLFLFDCGFLYITFYSLYLNLKDYKYKIKSYLNKKYGKNYPYVYILTAGNNESTGQVKDIFNPKYIILNNDRTEEIVLWLSIDILKIQEQKISENSSQKSILDFYTNNDR